MELESYYLWFNLLVLALTYLGVAFLLSLAIIVRNYDLIVNSPLIFTVETILMSILPGIPLLFFVISRKISFAKAWLWFGTTSIQFGIFHILLQLSGTYDWLFS